MPFGHFASERIAVVHRRYRPFMIPGIRAGSDYSRDTGLPGKRQPVVRVAIHTAQGIAHAIPGRCSADRPPSAPMPVPARQRR